jgi:outer membrane protein assembly factor BamB
MRRVLLISVCALAVACEDTAGLAEPENLWFTSLPGRSTFARMAAGDGAFYLGFGDSVFAISDRDGDVLWRAKSPSEFEPANLTYSGGLVFGAAAHAFALEASSGIERWSEPLPDLAALSSSAVGMGVFVVATSAAHIYAFDAQTGGSLWDVPVGIVSDFDVIPRTVRILGDVVFVGGIRNHNAEGGRAGAWLLALAIDDGQKLWLTEIGTANEFHSVHDGPVEANGRLLITDFYANTIHALDPASGSVLWSWQGQFPAVGAGWAPAVDEGSAYVASGDTYLYALDLETGRMRWRVRMQESQRTAVLCGAHLVAGGFALSTHDPASGAMRDWLIPHGAAHAALGPPVLLDRVLAVAVDEGVRAFECG